jgi:hypothetical protein
MRLMKFNIIVIFILLILICYVSLYIEKHYRQIDFNNSVKYDYIAISDNRYNRNDYYYYEREAKFYTKNNKRIPAFVIMELNSIYDSEALINENNIIKGKYELLKENEIAISYNISKKFNLSIGDYMDFYNISLNQKIKNEIKYIFKSSYGLYDIDVNNNYGIILMGFNKNYYDNIKSQVLVSLSKDTINSNKILNFIDIYKNNRNYFSFSFYNIFLMIFISAIYSYLYYISIIKNKSKKYESLIILGYEKKIIRLKVIRDFILFHMLSIIFLFFVIIINLILNGLISLFTLSIIFAILMIPTLFILILEIKRLNKI